jgi:serine/threonine protein kinase/Tfp pilus assembly protein PilF
VVRALQEMQTSWEQGRPVSAEDVLRRHPDLGKETEAALQIIQEELILRREAGQEVPTQEFVGRFPQWRRELERLLECHRLVESLAEEPPAYPEAGEALGDLELVAELGRGAHGRVYLARQRHLADRLLVLKMSPCSGQEHLSLARLQHTHIVPLYWAQDVLGRNLRVLFFPYLGGATLAEVLARLAGRPPAQRTGADLLAALDRRPRPASAGQPPTGPARQALARDSYPDAVCRLVACLAEALQYGHERGLLHLDVKPSNVLLAADGQPLLLDFHIARGPLAAGDVVPPGFGGTPGYMSPEQELLLGAARRAGPAPGPVDGRSDVYSLGRLLYEALGGSLPEPAGGAAASLRRLNPQVSAGLADVVARCLAARPGGRYPGAGALAADLRRHLADLPLRGVANRSWAERWRKWRRRSPYALPVAGLLLALLAALGTAVVLKWADVVRQKGAVTAALEKGRDLAAEHRYAEAVQVLEEGRRQADASFTTRDRVPLFDRHLRLARRGKEALVLHDLAEKIRAAAVSDAPSPRDVALLGALREGAWAQRDLLLDQGGAPLPVAAEQAIRDDLLDLAVCSAELSVQYAPAGRAGTARRAALRILDEAEGLLGPGPVIDRDRQEFARALGLPAAARRAAGRPFRTGWERMALGRSLLRAGRLREAAAALDLAVVAEPGDFWANFCLGACAMRLGRPEQAVRCFSTCVGTLPDEPAPFLERGRAFAALGRAREALRDYDRALVLSRDSAAARFRRGVLLYHLGRYEEAAKDLERAGGRVSDQGLGRRADPTEVHYYLALVHLARFDAAAARASLARALRPEPRQVQAGGPRDRTRAGSPVPVP